MSKEKSYMVVASKYQLEVPIVGKTAYKTDGQKILKQKDKIVPRHYVENRNSHPNNELWVIDEEKTAKMVVQREKNIIANLEKDRREKVSTADLVDAIAGKVAKDVVPKVVPIETVKEPVKETSSTNDSEQPLEGEPNEEWTIPQLKEYCDSNSITYHAASGVNKLMELITLNKES